MERRLGRDPFAQSGLDKIFNPVVEQATTPTPTPKPRTVKTKPRIKASREVKSPAVSDASATASSKGLPEGWTRATFIVRQDLVHKVKRAAYWDRKQIKDVVTEALDAYLEDKKTD
jgi:hypothetical protein